MALLALEEVSKNFGGLQALRRVSLEVGEGQIVALIGPNGAGKTTLFNIINGIEKPTSGNVFFGGGSIVKLPPHQRARLGIARTFQLTRLLKEMSTLENVMLGKYAQARTRDFEALFRTPAACSEAIETRDRATQLLRLVNLEEKCLEPAGLLPYGQQRLLELARSLATEPRLLLLDEPGAGLNPRESQSLQYVLRSIRNLGVTIFLVAHDMNLVMSIAEKIIVLNYGEKIAEGTAQEIRSNRLVIEAYLGRGYQIASS